VKVVAEKLGNRPATCRKYYIHPAVIDAYIEGSLLIHLKGSTGERREEVCIIKLVESYVARLSSPQPEDLTRQLRESVRRRA
jgi:DNA topoisomerase-1